jgi:hypothetical protein
MWLDVSVSSTKKRNNTTSNFNQNSLRRELPPEPDLSRWIYE